MKHLGLFSVAESAARSGSLDAGTIKVSGTGGAKRMQGLIEDLVTYSRVSTKGMQFARIDCESALSTTLQSLAVAISESSFQISHDPLPTVRGDPGQLGQLFQNLIGIAIKYRNGNPPEIHVSCARRATEWLFSVKDNGIGLAVCKIVERHGGKI